MRRALLALGLLLIVAPAAHAGGWATVGLDSTPTGKDWTVNVTVLQHGQTPLNGVTPKVEIRNATTTKAFPATATGKPGVYRAHVTFPSAGKWDYVVYDGFIANQAHTFSAVTIEPAQTATAEGTSWRWLAVPGIALLLAAAVLVLPRRRAGHQPQAA